MKSLILAALIATAPVNHVVTGAPNNLDNTFDKVGITSPVDHWSVKFAYSCPADQRPWFAGQVHLVLHRIGNYGFHYTDMYDQRRASITLGRPHAGSFSLRVQSGCSWTVTSSGRVQVRKLG